MKIDPPLLVLVEWVDTKVVDDDTWTHRASAKQAAPEVFQQVGWLLERTATQIESHPLRQVLDLQALFYHIRIIAYAVRDQVRGSEWGLFS